MAHRNSFTLIAISLLLVIPLLSAATDKHGTDPEDSSSGEAEIQRPIHHPDHGASPNEEEEENQPSVGQGQDPEVGEDQETAEQSTASSVAAVGQENDHLPRELDEDEEDEHEVNEHEEVHEAEENVEVTTLLTAPSSEVPLAPVPAEEEDGIDQDSNSHNETLRPEPSQTVVIWDGTGEPERQPSSNHPQQTDKSADQPEEPASQTEQPVNQPEQPVDQPEQPDNQPEQPVSKPENPFSQELHGGSNGNGQAGDTDEAEKSSSEVAQGDRPHSKPVPVQSSGSTSSSMAWIVVFAVVSSALLISGMSDSENDRYSSCHLGCRHNFDDFNPYAWPPTSVNRNEITLRPIT